ncbi:unnamed protein product [Toxocara canis]|uniref:Small conductance calcium-activated potassium channel protein n=1 Tax=Toxocara canis TaxID=6265 RepID=A0A183TUX7_TOXCA|nr:unnamed protein product [Toxocara canis]
MNEAEQLYTGRVSAGTSSNPSSPIAPHRGFNQKAREVLIKRDLTQFQPPKLNLMTTKSCSEFDLQRRILHSGGCSASKHSNVNETCGSSTKSSASTASVTGSTTATFDEIGDYPHSKVSRVKAHVLLGDIGKTRSAGDFFVKQRKQHPLFRTLRQDNIMKLPSVESDVDNMAHYRQISRSSSSQDSMKELFSDMNMVKLRDDRYKSRRTEEMAKQPHQVTVGNTGQKSEQIFSWLLDS